MGWKLVLVDLALVRLHRRWGAFFGVLLSARMKRTASVHSVAPLGLPLGHLRGNAFWLCVFAYIHADIVHRLRASSTWPPKYQVIDLTSTTSCTRIARDGSGFVRSGADMAPVREVHCHLAMVPRLVLQYKS
jgi:hypothetical protein